MDILMAASEMAPLAKTGGLADVVGALPLALSELGEKVSVFMPCYRGIEAKYGPEPTGVSVIVPILEGDDWVATEGEILKTSLEGKVDVYLVKNDDYFDRETLYTLPDGDYPDNCARFTFFGRAIMDFLKTQNWRPDLIHCHDWQTSLLPIYLKTIRKDDPLLAGLPIVFTIHNLGYQGLFWRWDMRLIGLPWEYFTPQFLEYWGQLNLLKGALVFSDRLTTVSKGYAREIQTPEYGLGMDGIIRDRAQDLRGILNGIDYKVWDPATDPKLAANYSAKDLGGKAKCKAALQKELNLPVDPEVPLIGCISRLTDQKGFDLIAEIMDRMMAADLQFALLGAGDRKYHDLFEGLALKYPRQAGIVIAYNDDLAHKIEAGSDLFLMPSLYEPCGLNQLISLKYGTVPVVRATGGLDDTIVPWKSGRKKGNGFKFEEYSAEALWTCLESALAVFSKPAQWIALQRNGMAGDFSWKASAGEYLELYREVTGQKKKAAVKKKKAAPAARAKAAKKPARTAKTKRSAKSVEKE